MIIVLKIARGLKMNEVITPFCAASTSVAMHQKRKEPSFVDAAKLSLRKRTKILLLSTPPTPFDRTRAQALIIIPFMS